MKSNYCKLFCLQLFLILLQATFMEAIAQNGITSEITQAKGAKLSEKAGILSKMNALEEKKHYERSTQYRKNNNVLNNFNQQPHSSINQTSSFYDYHEHNDKGVNIPMSGVTDAMGNTYITGVTSNEHSPEGNMVVIKIDNEGNQVWEAILPGTRYAVEMGVIIGLDINGNPIVSGTHWNGSDLDIKTVKFESETGIIIWESIFDNGNEGLDIPTAMHIGPDGSAAVTGITYINNSIKYLTVFYDPSGNLIWSVTDATSSNNTWSEPTAITIDLFENVYVTGIGLFIDDDLEYWLGYKTIKYDSNGNLIWEDTYVFEKMIDESDPNSELIFTDSVAQSIVVDSNENVYVTGTFDAFENSRIGTIKYDVNGNVEWVDSYRAGTENTHMTNGSDIIIVDNDIIYVGGRHRSNGWGSEGGIVLLSYDTEGNKNWEIESFNSIEIQTSKLIIDENNLPIIAGLGYDEGTTDHRVRVFKYSDQGELLNEANYFRESIDTQSITGMVHLGIDSIDNVYFVLKSFFSETGDVFESVKMHVTSGVHNPDWEHIYSNLFASTSSMVTTLNDADDNTFVIGRYGIFENDEYIDNFVLTKYNPQGIVEWEITFSSLNGEFIDNMLAKINSQGEIIIALLPDPFQNNQTLKLKKINTQGNIIWETEKILHSASIKTIFFNDNNNIIIAGSSRENITDPYPSFLTMKFSESGTELWANYVTTNDPNDNFFEINSGVVNLDGSFIFTGSSGFLTMFSQEVDLTILKYTSDGDLEWLHKYPQANWETSGIDIITDFSNNIFVAGVRMQINNNTEELVVLKVDVNGNEQWATTYNQTERRVRPYKLMQDSNGDLIIPSYSLFSVMFQPTNNRIATIKLNKNDGSIGWVHNTELHRYYYDSYIDGDDNVFILNQVHFSAIPYRTGILVGAELQKINQNGIGDEELFIAPELALFYPSKLSPLNSGTLLIGGIISFEPIIFSGYYFFGTDHTPLSNDDFENSEPNHGNWLGQNYPNPVQDITKIPFYLTSNERVKLSLYDSQGRYLFEIDNSYYPKGLNTVQLETIDLAPGVYFYQIEAGIFRNARKMIIK